MFAQNQIPVVRLGTAVGQGLALFLLYYAFSNKLWPATDPYVFVPLILLGFFLPFSFSAGLGRIRTRRLAQWLAIAGLLIIGIGVYAAYAYDTTSFGVPRRPLDGDLSMPGAAIRPFAFLCVFFLVAQTGLVAASAEQRLVASYRSYFDFAWKHVIQLAVMFVFALVFWLMMFLGAALFDLIGLKFLRTMIEHAWFVIPATTLIVTAALHVTDVRASFTAGIRTLALTLLSWLLPVMTLMVWAFLVSLPFTGLAPLWATQSAAALLLAVSAALIVLTNAVYQDGTADRTPPRILKIAATLAAASLLPMALIAADALYLRVAQYGWTPDRVLAAALVLIALGFAGGYAWAAVRRGPWLVFIERWNVVMACAVAAILLALFTPLADPARITASNQLARLKAGTVSLEQFDDNTLRFSAGRYGLQALKDIAEAGPAPLKEKAAAALKKVDPYGSTPKRTGALSENLIVAPGAKALPQSFFDEDWSTHNPRDAYLPDCIWLDRKCDAAVIDIDGDNIDEVLLFPQDDGDRTAVFRRNDLGEWKVIASLVGRAACADMRAAVQRDGVSLAPSPWPDIEIAGARFRLSIYPTQSDQVCPPGGSRE